MAKSRSHEGDQPGAGSTRKRTHIWLLTPQGPAELISRASYDQLEAHSVVIFFREPLGVRRARIFWFTPKKSLARTGVGAKDEQFYQCIIYTKSRLSAKVLVS